ncbi:isochorismate synthase [Lederbergia citrea]|uniref:isochorismate synthase n=1 Tax=Lederbergia citrea TaxID=2833581 RepID=A0A942UK03_9BACI|nr:isochorismate synthase [Lederbergia citrea]MBS4222850.1 isochorismate synthase [Lederbergia citrea]
MTKSLSQANFAIETEHTSNEGIDKLFSYTFKIDSRHPIDFFTYNQPAFTGRRFFWKSSDQSSWIVGIGVSHVFYGKNTNERFSEIQEQWETLINDAEIENPYEIPGTGPLLFGGFSFDPESKKEKEWQSYGNSLFYLPKYMLTANDEQYYLTINFMDQSASSKGMLLDEAFQFVNQLENWKVTSSDTPINIKDSDEIGKDEWVHTVKDIVKDLTETDLQKVVFARKMKLRFADQASSSYVLQQLIDQQPTSFIFAMEAEESCFLGASPERLVKKTGDHVLSTCLAGSMGRSKNVDKDNELGNFLLKDKKNLFEHELVVSMIENALKPYCVEMNIPEKPILMKTPDIQHLYTPVSGKTKPESSIFQIVKDLHPTPALGGVPTNAAMKVIREKENMDRGFYAAPLGWADYRGNGEFIVAIRSGILKEKEAVLFAGCGLVPGSVPKDELVETGIKFLPMLRALRGEKE